MLFIVVFFTLGKVMRKLLSNVLKIKDCFFKLNIFFSQQEMQEQCYDVCITSGLLWTFQKPTYNTKPGTTCCVFIKTCKSFHPVGCVISPINETFNNLVTFNF